MARVWREDHTRLASPVKRDDGTMIVEARLARTGVYKYKLKDGTIRREYRSEKQVFSKRSMDSFKLVPFTNNHPPEMLTADNARQYAVGTVGENIRRDGKWLVANIVVYDAATVRDIENGKREVSNGYECELVMTPGIDPETGEHYDAEQINILGNHNSLVDNARAGHDAAIHMDAAIVCDDDEPRQVRNDGDKTMDLTQALAALNTANNTIADLKSKLDAANAAKDQIQAKLDDANEKLTKSDKARTDAESTLDARVDAKVDLIIDATEILGDRCDGDDAEYDLRKMDARKIKLAVIKHVTDADCDLDPAGNKRSDEYIDARYDAALERAVEAEETMRDTHSVIDNNRIDSGNRRGRRSNDVNKARQDMIEANRTGNKRPA